MTNVEKVGGEFEKVSDKSVYWTASFYVSAQRIPRCLGAALRDRAELRRTRDRDAASKRLSEAMEPLFNDISDRERAGKIDDMLFAANGGDDDWIDIEMPTRVSWTTEGLTTTASPDEIAPEDTGQTPAPEFPKPAQKMSRRIRVRRFWYLHRDGALSWHLSFWLYYGPNEIQQAKIDADRERIRKEIEAWEEAEEATRGEPPQPWEDAWPTPDILYFLSRLQKVLAPKEFGRADGETINAEARVHRGDPTGIDPIDVIRVIMPGGTEQAFWKTVGDWFTCDMNELFDRVKPNWRSEMRATSSERLREIEDDPFDALIGSEAYLEIPQLRMPRFRYMFFFVDRTFFDRLLPPIEKQGRRMEPRVLFVNEACYAPFIEENKKLADATDNKRIWLDKTFWDWAQARGDVDDQLKRQRDRLKDRFPKWLEGYRADKPAWRNNRRADCLNYLFLSGFNQNIIDFMAQDASEILDSIDPIYPDTDDESGERFFVRYATPRAFITYVRGSRSLETGNDYIGTCPYAFLIHVLALHNEYLARDYEIHTEQMIDDIRADNSRRNPARAVQRFYKFRMGEFSDYARNRYGKVFRYDTEAKVFEAIEQRRGIERKTDYLDTIVENMEKQTADLEARLQRREDRLVTFAVGGVGVFGLFSFLFDVVGNADDADRLLQFPEFSAERYAVWLVWIGIAIVGLMALVMVPHLFAIIGGWVGRIIEGAMPHRDWTMADDAKAEKRSERLKKRD